MPRKTILITGALGLVGSTAMDFFAEKGWKTVGIDNNGRSDYFGTPRKEGALKVDITKPEEVDPLFKEFVFDAICHTAAQPSHDYSKENVLEDFQVNAFGTVYLLEAARHFASNAVFVHCSTDKIYGTGMNRSEDWYRKAPPDLTEKETRYHSEFPYDESTPIKPALSPFGVSKLYADFIVQEYAAQDWLITGTFRMGCITGSRHEGAEQHGFLAYLAKCVKQGIPYKIYGYKGKQVRDQIHAYDLVSAFAAFIAAPRSGAVYNMGGGPDRSISPLEALAWFETKFNTKAKVEYVVEPRFGDRQWDVHDIGKFRADYPDWDFKFSLDNILQDLCCR